MTPEDEEFERIEREAKIRPTNLSFNMTNPLPKPVMTLSCEGVWVDPNLSVDEAAKAVLGAIDNQVKHMVEMAVKAEREACAKVCEEEADDGTEGEWDGCCLSLARKIRNRSNT